MRFFQASAAFLLGLCFIFCAFTQDCSDQGTISTITANLTCDHFLEIYADGRLVGRNENYSAAYSYVINAEVDVIALKCRILEKPNSTRVGGILGSFSNGFVTNSSWKCTAEFERGWNTGNYVDTRWAHAKSHVANKGIALPSDLKKNVRQNAHWIWTQDNKNDTTVYCRHKLVERCTKVKSSFIHTEPQYTDHSLHGFVLKTTYTGNELECGMKCGQLAECVSFNMQYTSEAAKPPGKVCELNRATRKSTQLVERTGYRYYELIKVYY